MELAGNYLYLILLIYPQIIANILVGFPGNSVNKETSCSSGDLGSIPGSGRLSWRREWQPTPISLLGESHGKRCLAGYSL